ncbi:MAG: response regulator transcription factor [Anaerolineales bacterium]|nr:response regulator transcription factor [Anaerolineales bacterium]
MTLPGNVLLIDDEANLRHTLTRVLQQAGCVVSSAADGQEALQILQNTSFDLVYLDIHLPDMNGLQVLQQIRLSSPQLPVILFTAYASLQSALDAIRLGATDYLVKPIDPEVFVARTRVILAEQVVERRKRWLREQISALRQELEQLESQSSHMPKVDLASPEPRARFLKQGSLILDLQARRATLGDQVLMIPPTAFDYLVVLARHAPDPVDYATLVTEAQGYEVERNEAADLAKYHIHVLRQALAGESGVGERVVTRRGLGYCLLVDETPRPPS